MIKMTVTLVVGIYATFVIWGEPAPYAAADAATAPETVLAQAADFERPVILESTDGSDAVVTRAATQDVVVPDPAVIAASAPAPTAIAPGRLGEPVVVSLFREAEPAPVSETPEPEVAPELLRVTGTVVNMRSGPSTANAVVDALPRGTVAEAMGEPQNGWQQIRDVATGQTGWMSARFLEPS